MHLKSRWGVISANIKPEGIRVGEKTFHVVHVFRTPSSPKRENKYTEEVRK